MFRVTRAGGILANFFIKFAGHGIVTLLYSLFYPIYLFNTHILEWTENDFLDFKSILFALNTIH